MHGTKADEEPEIVEHHVEREGFVVTEGQVTSDEELITIITS